MAKKDEEIDRTNIAVMANSIHNIEEKVTSIDKTLRADYVTKDQLLLLKQDVNRLSKIVFGIIGVVSTAIGLGLIGAFLNAIIRKP